jgi:O-antigen/teichoic acid export membrane protein
VRGRFGQLSTFRRGFLSTFTLDVGSRGLSAVATVLFIRALDVGSFAYLVLFLNIGQFAGSALTGGIRMRYMRTEAERVSRGNHHDTGFALAMVASLLLVLGVASLAIAGVSVVDTGGSSSSRWLFVALTAAYTAGTAAIELGIYHYQAHLKFTRAGMLAVARSIAVIVVAIAALTGFIDSGPATAGAVAATVTIVGALICAPLLRRTVSTSLRDALADDFGREAAWLTLYFIGSAGFSYADIFIVGAFLNADAVSSYGAALRYLGIVLGPVPSLIVVMRVRTSQEDVIDSAAEQARIMITWLKRSAIPVAAVITAAAIGARYFIPLLDGGRYPDSVAIFQLLLLPALVDYVTLPASSVMLAQKRYRLLAIYYGVALAIQLAITGGVATVGGVVSVAAAASTVSAVEAAALAVFAQRFARRNAAAQAPGA